MSEEANIPTASNVQTPQASAPTVKISASSRPVDFGAPVAESKESAVMVILDAVSAVVAISFAALVYIDNAFKLF